MTWHFGICRFVDKSICSLWGLETWHIKDHRAEANQAVVMELSRLEKNEWTSKIAFPLAHWQYSFYQPLFSLQLRCDRKHSLWRCSSSSADRNKQCHIKVLYRATSRLLLWGSQWHDWNIKTHTFQAEPPRTAFIRKRLQITFHTLNKSRRYIKNNNNL